jgi:hypothetical protein
VQRQLGCTASGVAVLASTVLPWSSTAAAGRNGWETASLALALHEAVHQSVLEVFAGVWFAVPLLAATALVVSCALPRTWAAVALRVIGVMLVAAVLAVLFALRQAGWDTSLLGPLSALAGGAALVALAGRVHPQPPTRRTAAGAPGARS